MRTIRKSVISILAKGIGLLLGTTVITSCDKGHEEVLSGGEEYGTPSVSYVFKGTVTDENGLPISNVKVSFTSQYQYSGAPYANTDESGEYSIESGERTSSSITLAFRHEGYADKDTTIKNSQLVFKGGDGAWYEGKATANVDITLKKGGAEK
ncbi:MAG: radical SAM-associated putative lipoprotein [Paludibacteraceae bacterium]|nr:radical SAM-associated putative lipoprotein [Paludibacteraceae bacterium]